MLTATKAKRTTTKLVTDNNRELVVVCCLDKRRGIVLAVLGDGTGDCWAEELHADHVRGLTPDDVYCDAMPLLERRAKCTIDDEGRLERRTTHPLGSIIDTHGRTPCLYSAENTANASSSAMAKSS